MSTQWYLEGWYSDFSILSELLPAPWSSKMQILLLHISPEFFSSSAGEKIYFCLLEAEYGVTFLHQGHMDGSSLLRSLKILSSALPCHWRHLLQNRESSSFSMLSDSTAECARAAPAETAFSPLSSFSLSLLTLDIFVFSVYISVWCSFPRHSCRGGLTGKGSELAAPGDPQNHQVPLMA